MFAFWDIALGETPASIDEGWFHRFSNGHSITISGLTPGKTYPFAAAYKGSDSDTLVWSAIISKMVADQNVNGFIRLNFFINLKNICLKKGISQ
ncbi:MAG: hypothetical protein NTZ59_14320 [Bacteroidetes bacterium]|nr:hypothetical protein [Bacteroidota bacterium]